MASKGMTLSIKPEQVMATNIRRTKGGYNSASMAIKLGDNEYMSISYEWEGDNVTDTAMDFMGCLNFPWRVAGANKEEIEVSVEAHKESYAEYSAKKGETPTDEEDMMDE